MFQLFEQDIEKPIYFYQYVTNYTFQYNQMFQFFELFNYNEEFVKYDILETLQKKDRKQTEKQETEIRQLQEQIQECLKTIKSYKESQQYQMAEEQSQYYVSYETRPIQQSQGYVHDTNLVNFHQKKMHENRFIIQDQSQLHQSDLHHQIQSQNDHNNNQNGSQNGNEQKDDKKLSQTEESKGPQFMKQIQIMRESKKGDVDDISNSVEDPEIGQESRLDKQKYYQTIQHIENNKEMQNKLEVVSQKLEYLTKKLQQKQKHFSQRQIKNYESVIMRDKGIKKNEKRRKEGKRQSNTNLRSWDSYKNDVLNQVKMENRQFYEELLDFDQIQIFNNCTRYNVPRKSGLKSEDQKIFFGHEMWNVMLNMMIGIRTSMKNIYTQRDTINESDFTTVGTYNMVQKRDPQFDDSQASSFYDYAGNVFHQIRKIFGVSSEEYMRSIGPEQLFQDLLKGNIRSLKELCSSGKSGSFLYFSPDSKFILKTIYENEFNFLNQILPSYYEYVKQQPKTLLTRIYGLYKMRFPKRTYYIITFNNIFYTNLQIKVRYDLKGSLYGRSSRNKDWNSSIALKDKDFLDDDVQFGFQEKDKVFLRKQVHYDCNFLRIINVNDYSLLIGIYEQDEQERNCKPSRSSWLHKNYLNHNKEQQQQFGKNTNVRTNIFKNEDGTKQYFVGIIDLLTEYRFKKKLENGIKSVFQGSTISCIPPDQYADRFTEFVNKNVFK